MAKNIIKEQESTTNLPINESETYRQDIANDLADLKKRERAINTIEVLGKNKIKQFRQQIIGKFFELMKQSGVDLSDLSSIGNFVQKLEQQDPDLAQLFELAFNKLTNYDGEPALGNEEVGSLNDNNSQESDLISEMGNMAQNTMMPR